MENGVWIERRWIITYTSINPGEHVDFGALGGMFQSEMSAHNWLCMYSQQYFGVSAKEFENLKQGNVWKFPLPQVCARIQQTVYMPPYTPLCLACQRNVLVTSNTILRHECGTYARMNHVRTSIHGQTSSSFLGSAVAPLPRPFRRASVKRKNSDIIIPRTPSPSPPPPHHPPPQYEDRRSETIPYPYTHVTPSASPSIDAAVRAEYYHSSRYTAETIDAMDAHTERLLRSSLSPQRDDTVDTYLDEAVARGVSPSLL